MLKTEMRNEKTRYIDRMATADMVRVMQEENENAVRAVGEALPAIAAAIDAIASAMEKGGRLIYMGAGTSGRLGVLDASECPPTYGVPPSLVVGLIAGGEPALTRAQESVEDSADAGISDLSALSPNENDVVVGISAAGGAKYVTGALGYARSLGCKTVGITSNTGTPLAAVADIPIVTDTGAEVVTGSTRMKAGTAQKLVLNMLSTGAMVKRGYVYENLMINLRPSNEKLRLRMIRIVSDITGVSESDAERLLTENGFDIRRAVAAK